MTMKFCPVCKTLLVPHQIGEKSILRCQKCDYFKEGVMKPLIEKNKIKKLPERGKGVVNNENDLATYHNKCSKCGYEKAQIIDMGVFISDEDNLILLKCGKCGFSERIGRKVA